MGLTAPQDHAPLERALRDLGDAAATGTLLVRDPLGAESSLFLRAGGLYALDVPAHRMSFGARLRTQDLLTDEVLAHVREVQATELQGWRLTELVVHLAYVDAAVAGAYVQEQHVDALATLLARPAAAWRFRPKRSTRADVVPPEPVADLLDRARVRTAELAALARTVGGPGAVPVPVPGDDQEPTGLGARDLAVLRRVDGTRTVGDLADACGLSVHEASSALTVLAELALVDLVLPVAPPEPAPEASATRPEGVEAAQGSCEDEPADALPVPEAASSGDPEAPSDVEAVPVEPEAPVLEPETVVADEAAAGSAPPVPSLPRPRSEVTAAVDVPDDPRDSADFHDFDDSHDSADSADSADSHDSDDSGGPHDAGDPSQDGGSSDGSEAGTRTASRSRRQRREEFQDRRREDGEIVAAMLAEQAQPWANDRATAAALLRELSMDSGPAWVAAPAAAVGPADLPDPEGSEPGRSEPTRSEHARSEPDGHHGTGSSPYGDPADEAAMPVRGLADTAALLRELSSLGHADPPPGASAPPRPVPAPAAAPLPDRRKRRGLLRRS